MNALQIGASLVLADDRWVWEVRQCPTCGRIHQHDGGRVDGDPHAWLGVRTAPCGVRRVSELPATRKATDWILKSTHDWFMTSNLRAGAHVGAKELEVTLSDLRENGWIAGLFTQRGEDGIDYKAVDSQCPSNAAGRPRIPKPMPTPRVPPRRTHKSAQGAPPRERLR